MSGVQIACLRSAFAAIALLAILPEARRNWNWRVCLLAVAYALTLIAFAMATKLTTSASAIFLQNTAPVYILALAAVLLDEKPARSDLLLMVPLALGMALFFASTEQAAGTAPNPGLGNIFAAFSGLFWAIVVVGFRWLSRSEGESGSQATAALGNALAFLFCLPFAWPLPSGRAVDWTVLGALGIFQIALPYVLLGIAMKQVRALEASLLLLLEPVLNPLWTWLVYRERPGNMALAGGVLIISATAVKTWWSSRSPGPSVTARA